MIEPPGSSAHHSSRPPGPSSRQLRKQWRDLGLWIFFGVVGGGANLWCAIQIPYDFSMICAAAGLGICGGSWYAAAFDTWEAREPRADGAPPVGHRLQWVGRVCAVYGLILCVNYIDLAEAVDRDTYALRAEDELEQLVESNDRHDHDWLLVHIVMVTDLVLLAVAFKLAEASIKLALTLRGEHSRSRPFSLVLCQRLADDSVFSRVLFPRTQDADDRLSTT